MIHASPFFESILTGEWAETTDLNTDTHCSSQSSRSSSSDHINIAANFSGLSTSPPIQSTHSDGFDQELFNSDITQSSSSSRHQPSTQSSPSTLNFQSSRFENPRSNCQLSRASNFDSMIPPQTLSESMALTSSVALHSFHSHVPRAFNTSTTNDEADQGSSTSAAESSSTPTGTNQLVDSLRQSTLHSNSLSVFIRRSNDMASDVQDTTVNKQFRKQHQIEARICFKEERDASFQDLLMFVYPHLECVCTWHNASDLMTMSQKFDMPLLKRHVLNFLISSVAGKPIEAMKIAEEHQLPELYRESSRFLLDNWQGWDDKELESLSSETLLKLEKRRTWFLERLLKLGLVNSSRDYVCPSSCPDPQHCTKLVDDKWRSAWAASFKFGPPQPSSVYRALRCLEPSLHSPALLLPHTSCQQHALRFFADLFDRMFSQFTPRGGGGSGANASNNSISITGTSSTGIHSQNSLNLNNATSAGSEQPQVSTHNNPITSSTSSTPNVNSINNIGSFSMMNSSGSSHIFNSDKTIRKAKYFLHVELFDNHTEKSKKRFE